MARTARTNAQKNTAVASSKKDVDRDKEKPRTGERLPGLDPPIGYYHKDLFTKKVTETDTTVKEANSNVVSFPVKLDPTGLTDSSNRHHVKVKQLLSFTEASESFITVREFLPDVIFMHLGIMVPSNIQKRFNYLKGCMAGEPSASAQHERL